MKKILSLVLALALTITASVVFAEGSKIFSQQVTLFSAVSGTTSAFKTSAFTFDSPVSKIACDLIGSQTTGTGNITLVLYGNQGSSTTLFDTGTAYLITSQTLASSTTLTVMKTVKTVDVPFRTMQASLTTAQSTTQSVTLNCTGMQ